ncbi:Aldehyde reductase 2 [Fusarium oxysporum f. sp. albedinis]|nr:Aldehyde reductase 2 [Fusarium oxysporum f. sp. albedinis]
MTQPADLIMHFPPNAISNTALPRALKAVGFPILSRAKTRQFQVLNSSIVPDPSNSGLRHFFFASSIKLFPSLGG